MSKPGSAGIDNPVEKRPAGRPSEMTDGKRVNVYLDAASLAAAAKLGNGNVSEGVRKALEIAAGK